MATRETTSAPANPFQGFDVGNLFDLRAVFDPLRALGDEIVEEHEGDDSVFRMAIIGIQMVDRMRDNLPDAAWTNSLEGEAA